MNRSMLIMYCTQVRFVPSHLLTICDFGHKEVVKVSPQMKPQKQKEEERWFSSSCRSVAGYWPGTNNCFSCQLFRRFWIDGSGRLLQTTAWKFLVLNLGSMSERKLTSLISFTLFKLFFTKWNLLVWLVFIDLFPSCLLVQGWHVEDKVTSSH